MATHAPLLKPILVEQVRCPATYQPLSEADGESLGRLNDKIAAGGVRNVGGAEVTAPLVAGLLRADGAVLYPVAQPKPGVLIPRLLTDEGIEVGDA